VIGAVELMAEASPTPEPRPRSVVDRLLAEPCALVDEVLQAHPAAQLQVVRVLLLAILASTAAFGAAIGFTRGGVQVLFAAVKLPLVVVLTAAVSTPALTALSLALGRETDLRRDLLRVLAALGRGSLVLAALSPVMLVASSVAVPYHQAVILCVACCAVSGAIGLPPLAAALWAQRRGRFFVIAAMTTVVLLAGTQTSWMFRPYLVRPRTASVPFFRGLDGTFADSVSRSSRSARGIYDLPVPIRSGGGAETGP
jgi:uncharacterized integral membrane protein